MFSRRMMIAAGAGVAGLAGLGYRGFDRGAFLPANGPAYEAWDQPLGEAGTYPALRPIDAAILASSAHNTQPWLFEAHEDVIAVYADLSKNLGAADPFRRELYASLGCAIHNLGLASGTVPREMMPEMRERLTPDPSPSIVKVCDFIPGHAQSHGATLDTLFKRHTNRGPYRDRAVPSAFLRANDFVTFVTDPVAVTELGALIVEATTRFIADAEMSRDSGRWMRTGRRQIEATRDGVTVDTAGLSPLMTGLAKLLPDQDVASADRYWLASTRDVQVPTAAAYGVLFTSDRLVATEAIAAGMDWQAFHLAATAAGLAAQPMNAPIELMDRDAVLGQANSYASDIGKMAGVPVGGVENDVAFLFRLGYGERDAVRSPRRRFDDVIRSSRPA